jgi:hypothetical protein
VAKPVYKKNISYGLNQQMCGHWEDRLPGINDDIEAMKKGQVIGTPAHPGAATAAINVAKSRPTRPASECRHDAPTAFVAGIALPIVLSVAGSETKSVNLYYRRVNQAEQWQVQPMNANGGEFHGVIPAACTQTNFPLQYYFALNKGDRGGVPFPGLDSTLANQPCFVVRLKKQA